jgi:hypothetical protein
MNYNREVYIASSALVERVQRGTHLYSQTDGQLTNVVSVAVVCVC